MSIDVKKTIKNYGLRLTKSLGQNFLIDQNIVNKIVDESAISKDDLVLEIGPGVGSMTAELAERAGRVVAIEIDKHLIEALSANLSSYSNVRIINKDVLDLDINEILDHEKEGFNFKSAKVVANLPYYITTPIIMKFLEEGAKVDAMIFMVQKEVAERMTANPGCKEYGALTVAVNFYSKPSKLFTVAPYCFIPQPEVFSTIIKLEVYGEPIVSVCSKDIFFRVVKAAFGQRRKTLVNALVNTGNFSVTKEEVVEILESIGLGEKIRGETLDISKFASLADLLFNKNS